MNQIHVIYIDLSKTYQSPVPDTPRYKEYLKQLILENIPDVHFSRPLDRIKREQIFSTKIKDQLLSNAQTESCLKDDLSALLRAIPASNVELLAESVENNNKPREQTTTKPPEQTTTKQAEKMLRKKLKVRHLGENEDN